MMENMKWQNNTIFPDDIDIQKATELLIWENKDNGKTGAVMVMPSTNNYKGWIPLYHRFYFHHSNIQNSNCRY